MNKNTVLLFLFGPILFYACKNTSVEEEIPNQVKDDQAIHDSILAIRHADTLMHETIATGSLLADSVDGTVNEMVYQNGQGLRVEWTRKTKGAQIAANDLVMVNYSIRVAGGKPFDSNTKIGHPIPLKTNIGMMIEGWELGLLQMHPGDKGRVLIPGKLGYGEQGIKNLVPPNADLVLDIEVVERIKPIVLEEGVKVYKWKTDTTKSTPVKNQLITFDYFAYTVGKDAKRYDNSFKNQEPYKMKFENDNVVDGLHQGMSVMRENEAAFIEIPANLAYGKKGLVDLVPKNTAIVYDVRIKSIK
jgi:FKBP-type peptidyl-prolyl cis-trans isomerase